MSAIDTYLKKVDEPERAELERIRALIHEHAAGAQEVITYGMPGFTFNKKYLISFAAFKDHLSVFPGPEPIEQLKSRLNGYKTSRGTIQFSLEQPLSDALLKEIIAICVRRNSKIK